MTEYRSLGKYEIRRQIGRGAMGVVFEGFDPVIERRVAIKTLRLELFEPSQVAGVRARFKREAQAAGRLSHPHIVTIYDYGEHEGTPYIAMEYMSGNELRQHLERGMRFPLSEIARLMTQLLGALAYAHERKLVHRDIKPANIFILDDGSLKVVDFGIAHVEASDLTDTGALLGTPAYMSPEQFLALPVDERSDIFSAGVILYELLTGDKPFTGSVATIMQKVLRQEPIEPSVLNPTLAAAWDTVVKRAMAKKPESRFQSARQFAESVKSTLAAGNAAGADTVEETLRPGTIAGESDTVIPRGFPAGRRIAAAFGVVIAVAAAYGLVSWWRSAGDDRQKEGSQQLLVAEADRAAVLKAEPAKSGSEPAAVVAMAAPQSAERTTIAAPRAASRSEREVAAHTDRPAAAVASSPAAAVQDAESMYRVALALDNDGKAADAVRIYRRAARAGSGKAAKRLGDIFDRGVPGVSRDYAESLQWYETARSLGETVEISGKR